jgi:hypothetical protein
MVSRRGLLVLFVAAAACLALKPWRAAADAYLPLLARSVARDDLPRASTAEPTITPAVSPTTIPTASATAGATEVPTATPSPTATEHVATGQIHGRITVEGEPLWEGYGKPPFPQIQLRRRSAGEWDTVALAETDSDGRFAFVDPPALAQGEVYQVWWVNEDSEDMAGDYRLLGRWWSRLVAVFGSGEDVDVGEFELADLTYLSPCHDCHQTPPITYRWRARKHDTDVYRWSLHRRCSVFADQLNSSFRTESLGKREEYETGPPPGFRLDETYCWYIYIEDGHNGSGWPYFEWRTAYLSGSELGGAGASVVDRVSTELARRLPLAFGAPPRRRLPRPTQRLLPVRCRQWREELR